MMQSLPPCVSEDVHHDHFRMPQALLPQPWSALPDAGAPCTEPQLLSHLIEILGPLGPAISTLQIAVEHEPILPSVTSSELGNIGDAIRSVMKLLKVWE